MTGYITVSMGNQAHAHTHVVGSMHTHKTQITFCHVVGCRERVCFSHIQRESERERNGCSQMYTGEERLFAATLTLAV